MAMFAPIPLPEAGNPQFKDVMDYFDTLQARKAAQQQAAQELAEKQRQFGVTSDLEKQKLAQGAELNPLRMELLKAKILAANRSGQPEGIKLSAQERTQAMKLQDAGRQLKSIHEKTTGIDTLLDKSGKQDLTGWMPGIKNWFNKGGEDLNSLIQKTGNLQAALGKLASQRGGAQVIKWTERMKPNQWKDYASNKGMTKSILEDTVSDFNEIKNEYEALTGKPYPVQLSQVMAGGNNTETTSTAGMPTNANASSEKPVKRTKYKIVNGQAVKE